jgi:hypothetical protein
MTTTNYQDEQEFNAKVLHLINHEPTCYSIAKDMIALAEKLGWLDTVKFGHRHVFPTVPQFVKPEQGPEPTY